MSNQTSQRVILSEANLEFYLAIQSINLVCVILSRVNFCTGGSLHDAQGHQINGKVSPHYILELTCIEFLHFVEI